MFTQIVLNSYVLPLLDEENQVELATKLVCAIRAVVYFLYVVCRAAYELLTSSTKFDFDDDLCDLYLTELEDYLPDLCEVYETELDAYVVVSTTVRRLLRK